MLIKRTISSKNNRKLPVSLSVRLNERVVLSLLWDTEQISQVELASDGPTSVWTGAYIIQQVLEDWPLWQTWENSRLFHILFMEIPKIFMGSQQKKKTSTNKENLIYFLIIHKEQLKIKLRGNLLMKTHTHILLLFLSLCMMNMKIETWILDFYSYCSLLKNKTNGTYKKCRFALCVLWFMMPLLGAFAVELKTLPII